MRITNNVRALNGWRNMSGAVHMMERSMGRLSSGYRINSAADDAPGLAMSERMRANIGGMKQAMKNVQDGISYVQTTEGGLHEMADILQRGREISVQAANGTLTPTDREFIQQEMEHLLAEVDRITDATEFNGRKTFRGNDARVSQFVDSLRRSFLASAETLIETHYGLTGDGASLKIVADKTGPALAFVWGIIEGTGKLTSLELHVNLSAFPTLTLPGGGTGPAALDRVIAHEMVHAVMARTMDFTSLPKWFSEGSAEFIHGADERLQGDIAAAGGIANLVTEIDVWSGTSADYAAGYAAVKYLHSVATGGIKAVMARLTAGDTFDQAIANTTTFADEATFRAAFKGAPGQAFITGLNLSDADVGGIGGGDTNTTVPDSNSWDRLVHFQEIWPDARKKADPMGPLQIGPLEGQTLEIPELQVGTYALDLINIDLVDKASEAIDLFDSAIARLSGMRSQLGAIQNRLEHTYNVNGIMVENLTASESKIRDADMAMEMSALTRRQILVQSSTAMLAQANLLPSRVIRTLLG